jgi:hypothetical protein
VEERVVGLAARRLDDEREDNVAEVVVFLLGAREVVQPMFL